MLRIQPTLGLVMLRNSKQSLTPEQKLTALFNSENYLRQTRADALLREWKTTHDADVDNANRYTVGQPLQKKSLLEPRDDGFVDLHQHTAASVYYFIRREIGRALTQQPSKESWLKLVTGKGNHSRDSVPVLKPLVTQLCDELKLPWFHPNNNTGRIIITLKRPAVLSNALSQLLDCYSSVSASQAAAVVGNSVSAVSTETELPLILTDADSDSAALDVSPSAPEGTAGSPGALIIQKASSEEEGLDVSASAPEGTAALSAPIKRPSMSFFAPQKSTLSADAKIFVPQQFKTYPIKAHGNTPA